jgi:hypothetical protein
MPVVASDLVPYAAANMPNSDSGAAGGAIDPLRRCDFTQMGAASTVRVRSSVAGDTTQTVTIRGRLASGAVVQEVLTLAGTTNVVSANTYERILSAELSATTTGAITVEQTSGPTVLRTIPAGERGFMAIFRELASDPSAVKNYYGKFFWKNNHGTLALTSSIVQQNADGSGLASPDGVTHLPAATVNDAATSTNRVTAPGVADTLDPDTFDDADKTIGTLNAGQAWGVWLRLRLPTGQAPLRTTYTTQITGQSV